MPGPRNTKNKKKKDKTKSNRQLESSLMQLPLEMRIEIYSHFFFSTRLALGERALGRTEHQRSASAPNILALLRTCRQIHVEIDITWLQQVLFSFESPEAMLNKLANIPFTTRALIRHARVSGDPLMLSWEDDDNLLPGLALDRLTILSSRVPEVRYQTLGSLVRQGTGWKELYYLSHDSKFLAYEHDWFSAVGAPDEHRYLRVPQPAGWQRVLESAMSTTHAAFAQTLPAGKDLTTFGKEEDAALTAPGELEKEVLVVVRRGRGADYVEKANSPYLEDGDIREALPGKTWRQIKADQDSRFDEYDKFDKELLGDYEEEEDPPVVEAYTHVDEYVWPPLHFQSQ
ncbi:hypothetical protein K438DRAFT_1942918 [Mycena galopus ATCC 62051]|nr:hypothetical protein K438DRAFT_1942918 [Mycena galopus ATCC 62051]